MLYLIGLGLHDEKDLTLRAIETAKNCDCYCELYTSKWHGSLKNLENMIGKPIIQLKRKDLEENLNELLEKAKEKDIAVFVPGDPLAATTHIDLILEAKKKKIPVQTIHNASIFSAIAECGLQLYKFGKSATIPFTEQLESVRRTIFSNRKIGSHTLLLLDVDSEIDLFMSVQDALKILLKKKVIFPHEKMIALGKLGSDTPEIQFGTAKDLKERKISTPSVLILPGRLHFREKDFLEMI